MPTLYRSYIIVKVTDAGVAVCGGDTATDSERTSFKYSHLRLYLTVYLFIRFWGRGGRGGISFIQQHLSFRWKMTREACRNFETCLRIASSTRLLTSRVNLPSEC